MQRFLIQLCFYFAVVVVLCNAQAGEQYGCGKDACKKTNNKCKEGNDNCSGRLVKNAVMCGCCHHCVHQQLQLDSVCDTQVEYAFPRSECGSGLVCYHTSEQSQIGKCGYTNSKCIQTELQFEKQKSGSEGFTMGQPKPKCNTFGEFEPVQCKEGMKCYCVDINGNRIFGEAPYTEEGKINCSCSRDFESFKQHIKNPSDAHLFLRCSSTGDYAPTQCGENACYCVDQLGNVTKRPVAKENLHSLLCPGESFENNQFDTSCIAEYKQKMEEIKNMTGKLVLGIEPPSCDLDGSYSPVQCQGFECYCVTKKGEIQGKRIVRNSEQAKKMKCTCMREKILLTAGIEKNYITDISSKYKCRDNGNYLPVQCTNSVCFCVDEYDGFQNGPPLLVNNRRQLECYQQAEDYEKKEFEEKLLIIWD